MKDVETLLKEAQDCATKGDIDAAISKCEEARSNDPKNTVIYIKLAELYTAKGQNDKASEQYLTIANAYYESRLFKGAMKYFKNVVELDSQCLPAREKLAQIYENEDMEREAKIEFLNIAEMYLSLNDLHKAENFAAKSIELKSIEAHYILGLVHLKREMFKEAIAEFEALLKFKPSHLSAITNIAYGFIKLNKFNEAINYFEKAIKFAPDDISLKENLAQVYYNSGNKGSAVELAKKIIAVDSSNTYAKKILEEAESLAKRDASVSLEAEEAKPKVEEVKQTKEEKPKVKEQIVEKENEPEPDKVKIDLGETDTTPLMDVKGSIEELFIKAEDLLKDGSSEKAIEIYRYILRHEPNNITVRQKLHQAYILAAQQEEEITEVRKMKVSRENDTGIKKEKKSKISYL